MIEKSKQQQQQQIEEISIRVERVEKVILLSIEIWSFTTNFSSTEKINHHNDKL